MAGIRDNLTQMVVLNNPGLTRYVRREPDAGAVVLLR